MHQAPVANLVRKYFHDRLSKIAEAMKSENPEQAKTDEEAFLSAWQHHRWFDGGLATIC